MRSSEAEMRRAATMMRRSVATGCWQRRDLEAVLLDLRGDRVDGVVAGDDRLGEREVGVEQRLGRPVHRGADESGHLDEVVAHPVELLVVGLAHGGGPRRRSRRRSRGTAGPDAQPRPAAVPAAAPQVNGARRAGEHPVSRVNSGRSPLRTGPFDGRSPSPGARIVVAVDVAAGARAGRGGRPRRRRLPVGSAARDPSASPRRRPPPARRARGRAVAATSPRVSAACSPCSPAPPSWSAPTTPVLRASAAGRAPSASSQGGRLDLPEILALVTAVRRDGVTREEDLELRRPPLGKGVLAGPGARRRAVPDRRARARRGPVRGAPGRRRTPRLRRQRVATSSRRPVGALSLLAEAVQSASDDPEAVQRFAAPHADRVAAAHQPRQRPHRPLAAAGRRPAQVRPSVSRSTGVVAEARRRHASCSPTPARSRSCVGAADPARWCSATRPSS